MARSRRPQAYRYACSENDGRFALTWTERGGPCVDHQHDGDGFGALLARAR